MLIDDIGRHYVSVLNTTVGYSLGAMISDLVCHLNIIREEHGIYCMPCSSQIISEMLPEIHTTEKYYFSNL